MENQISEPEKKKRGRPKASEAKTPAVEKPKKEPKPKKVVEKLPPKKRGRKSKAELEALKNQSHSSSINEEASIRFEQQNEGEQNFGEIEFEKEESPLNKEEATIQVPLKEEKHFEEETQKIKPEAKKSDSSLSKANLKIQPKAESPSKQNETQTASKIIFHRQIIHSQAIPEHSSKSEGSNIIQSNSLNKEGKDIQEPHKGANIFNSSYDSLPFKIEKEKEKLAEVQAESSQEFEIKERMQDSSKFDYFKYFSHPPRQKCCAEVFYSEIYMKRCLSEKNPLRVMETFEEPEKKLKTE